MKPLLCFLILGCLGLHLLAKPPKQTKEEDAYLKNEMARLRDSATYRQYLGQELAKTDFCFTADTNQAYIGTMVDSVADLSGPGGMLKFMLNNVKYPIMAREYGIEGKIIAKFMIDESGNLCNPVIVRYLGFGIDEETIRILGLLRLQKWRPATKAGIPVKSYVFMPITFKLS